jgi:3-phenylpropionate/trans-cinnamate dioxygenase ferredoxin component
MPEFVKVASTSEIPKGEGRTFEAGGKRIAVFNCNGTFYAIDDTCKHQGGPLGEGELDGTTVTCPWHGWTYDITTGVSPDDSDCAVDRYEVKVEGDCVMVGI